MVINIFLRGAAATKQSPRNHEIASLSTRNDLKQTNHQNCFLLEISPHD